MCWLELVLLLRVPAQALFCVVLLRQQDAMKKKSRNWQSSASLARLPK